MKKMMTRLMRISLRQCDYSGSGFLFIEPSAFSMNCFVTG
jgi:hypothetical protein